MELVLGWALLAIMAAYIGFMVILIGRKWK